MRYLDQDQPRTAQAAWIAYRQGLGSGRTPFGLEVRPP
ncbi:MAG: hypothetical protein ACI841_004622 [Planctomycetota bacterium]|jgi:hypothetical protein